MDMYFNRKTKEKVHAIQYIEDDIIDICAELYCVSSKIERLQVDTITHSVLLCIILKDRKTFCVKALNYIVIDQNGDISICKNGQFEDLYEQILLNPKKEFDKLYEQVTPNPIMPGTKEWYDNEEEKASTSRDYLKHNFPQSGKRIIDSGKSFGEAFEAVRKGKGMRLPTWEPDVVIRMAKPAELSEYSPSKESVAYSMCTDVAFAINRETEEEEDEKIRDAVRKRIHEQMTAPFLYVESRYGRVPWKETMIELFAENWEIVE